MSMNHFHARVKRPRPQRQAVAATSPHLPRRGERLDARLVQEGLAPSRTVAQRWIEAGWVRVDGEVVRKAAVTVAPGARVTVIETARTNADDGTKALDAPLGPTFSALPVSERVAPEVLALSGVSRAQAKIAAALDHLSWSVQGVTALDVGQSTGGFTAELLARGAARVVGLEVGHGQLAASLLPQAQVFCYGQGLPDAAPGRLVVFEGCNARSVRAEALGTAMPAAGFELLVGDVSFISATLVWPAITALAANHARLLWLIKPQFEVGRTALDKHGIVRDVESHLPALKERLQAALATLGWKPLAFFESALRGGGVGQVPGNREWWLAAQRGFDAAVSMG